LLDYDYFSGLNNAGVSYGGTANTEEGEDLGRNESSENFNHNRARGQVRERATEGWPVGRESGSDRVKLHEYARIEAEQAGQRLAGQAGAEFSNPFTSELAQDSENTSPSRSANGPVEEALRAEMQRSGNIEPRISRIYTDGQQGDAQETCAGDAFSNPSTIELEQDSENTSPTRFANDPAGTLRAGELGSDGGNQPADSAGFLDGQSQAGLQMDNQKGPTIRTANDPTAPGEYSSFDLRLPLGASPCGPTPGCSSSRLPERSVVLIRDIGGQKASSPATSHSPLVTAPEVLRAPYFMHTSVYHRGLHKRRSLDTALNTRHSPPVTRHSAEGASPSHQSPATSYSPQRRRRFRIGFFGTHDREFYTKHYHFQGMNRFEILEVFLQKFGNRMRWLRGFPRDWDGCEIAVSIDSRGGDRRGKSFLSQDHYFEALRECDFVLSPPGWCMPLSHNLVEAMFCGAIPITNGGAYMAEPLADDVNYLAFKNVEELAAAVERALAMDVGEVERMRWAVLDYYERFLEPKAFAEELRRSDVGKVFVNAEENSVPFVFPGKF
jgi:hypothetical protein